jgi:dipeptidyl aminopeptidase/acylaminoacyl peptidase
MMQLQRVVLVISTVISGVSTMLGQGESRRFKVRDSIEMTTFSDPAQIERRPKTSFSPDGSKFLVVTSRGEIATDEVHSELLLYDVASVQHYLAADSTAVAPKPRRLAALAAVPNAFAVRSYAPLITALHWAPDSRSVYFLGEQSDGSERLYVVQIANAALRLISPSGVDVRDFAINGRDEAVFFGGPRDTSQTATSELNGVSINDDARVVTGLPMEQILFPTLDNGVRPRVDSLWLSKGSGPARMVATNRQLGGPDIDNLGTRLVELSPDGRSVICILPVVTVPASWRRYDPLPVFEQRRIDPENHTQTSPFNFNRVRAYFLIDMRTGRSRELIDAPHAGALGYHDRSMAIWSPRGTTLLVTDTFLPLDGGGRSSGERQHSPCTALAVHLDTQEQQCIVSSRDQYHGKVSEAGSPLQLVDAHFDPADDQSVFLEFAYNTEDVSVEENYVHEATGWQKTEQHKRIDDVSSLSIYINQDLNTPATLWVRDISSQRTKELMDPNPQLRDVRRGHVSTYRWTDETGRKWTGGLVLPVDYMPSKRYPLVIQTHGFEDFEFLADGLYPTAMAAQPLASVGIVVLQMGYTYDHMATTQEVEDQLLGYRSAIEQLERDGIIDRQRVGIIGFSRTAWHVEAALVKAPHLFAAATLADGVDEGYLQYMILGDGNLGFASEFNRINGGPPFGEGMKRWVDRVVGFHLDQVHTPVRIEAIGPVSLLAEWEIYASLRQQHKPVDLIYTPHGQHILQTPLGRLASQDGNVAWFCFWLLDRDADSTGCPTVPPQQMEHWKEMRANFNTTSVTKMHGEAP